MSVKSKIIPILAQSAPARGRSQSKTTLTNWFVQENPADNEEFPFIIYPTPGTTLWATADSGGPIRQLFEHKGLLYYIGADKFYSIDTDKTQTEIGTLNTSQGRISIAAIDDEIMFVDGTSAYHYKVSTTTFSEVTDEDFPSGATTITAQDGYFMVEKPNDDIFYISNLTDGTSWEAADFAAAEGKPDLLVAVYSHRRYLWLFGQYTTEIWFNSANVDFPFEKQNGIFIEYGCAAKHSVVEAANELYWIGRNRNGTPVIFRSNGFAPAVVSSRAINYQLSTYSRVDDAFSWSYTQEGHEFVVFSFPTANKTWVYDVTTGAWHEREYFDGNRFGYHVGNCLAQFDDKILIGARDSANIYQLDLDTYTDNGNRIRRHLVSDHLDLETRRGSLYNFQVKLEQGIGLESGQGEDPQIMLRVSKDYGNTWGNEMWRSPGKLGEYKDRALWTRLGESRVFTFELTVTDPVQWIIHGARADLEMTRD